MQNWLPIGVVCGSHTEQQGYRNANGKSATHFGHGSTEWQANDKHSVRSFLGLAGYYRRFIKGFADMAKPLIAMLIAKSIFKWGPGEQSNFVKASSGKRTNFDAA